MPVMLLSLARTSLLLGALTGVNVAHAVSMPVHYEPGARVCGQTMPYQSDNEDDGVLSPGLQVGTGEKDNNKGPLDVLVAIRNPMSISQGRTKMDRLADFLSAIETAGVRMCILGAFAKQTENDPQYALIPESFVLRERPEQYLNPSELTGTYAPVVASPATKDYRILLTAVRDEDVGLKFRLDGLDQLLKTAIPNLRCAALEAMASDVPGTPSVSVFGVRRIAKNVLNASVVFECSAGARPGTLFVTDPLEVQLDFARSVNRRKAGLVLSSNLKIRVKRTGSDSVTIPILRLQH